MAFYSGSQDACCPAPPAVSPLRSLLLSVSSALTEAELSSMKFLCRDRIPKRRMEAVRTGAELFTILLEQQDISVHDLAFLRALLQHIRRADLLEQVRRFEEQGQPGAAPGDEPDEQEQRLLRVAFAVVCENTGKEWKRLMRELGVSEVKLDRIEAAHGSNLREQIFQGLWEWQKSKGKDAKVADLIKALRACRMNYTADLVEEAISKLNTGTGRD